jgi:hypothetical protein
MSGRSVLHQDIQFNNPDAKWLDNIVTQTQQMLLRGPSMFFTKRREMMSITMKDLLKDLVKVQETC